MRLRLLAGPCTLLANRHGIAEWALFELSATPPRALIVSQRGAAAAAWAQTLREVGCVAEPCGVADAPTAAYTADAALLLPDALEVGFIQKLRAAAGSRAFSVLCAKDGYEPALEFVDGIDGGSF